MLEGWVSVTSCQGGHQHHVSRWCSDDNPFSTDLNCQEDQYLYFINSSDIFHASAAEKKEQRLFSVVNEFLDKPVREYDGFAFLQYVFVHVRGKMQLAMKNIFI